MAVTIIPGLIYRNSFDVTGLGLNTPATTGNLYFNLHTLAFGGGELRGQIMAGADGDLSSSLSGDQEVPPNDSEAFGLGSIDRSGGGQNQWDVAVTVYGIGIDAATLFHIHEAPAGSNGGVVLNFDPDGALRGDDAAALRAAGFTETALYRGDGARDMITGTAIEDSIEGGGGADILNGAGGNDRIAGERGNDLLGGGNGRDTLDGGAGGDTVNGGAGNDTLDGGNGNDKLNAGRGNDALNGGNGNDTLNGGDGKDTATGGAGDDKLTGGIGTDALFGGSGNDQMDGDAGDDEMLGGTGADTMEGGIGDDLLEGGGGSDQLSGGSSRDTLDGGNGNDTMDGGVGFDRMDGGNGRDRLEGGDGNDTMDGGNGADTFVYSDRNDGRDTILNFAYQVDVLELAAGVTITRLGVSSSSSDGDLTTVTLSTGTVIRLEGLGGSVSSEDLIA